MLRSFRLANHRSFADEQELLLMPSSGSDERAVVPVTAVYGANASGKSNLLDGLQFMRSAVLWSFTRWEAEGAIPRRPFRLRPGWRAEPSLFTVEIVADAVTYTYGFTLNDDEILEEWLYAYPEKRKRVLFERTGGDVKFGTTVSRELKPRLELLEEITRPNALFLSACAQVQIAELTPVYHWFRRLQMRIGSPSPTSDRLAEQIARLYRRKPDALARIRSLVVSADVGISDLLLEEDDDPVHAEETKGSLFDFDVRPELKVVHGLDDVPFDLDEESAGTLSWLTMLPMILDALDDGQLVAVDEIDTSLHPLLTAQFVRLFHSAETNPNGAQLIFTSHDSSLLGTMIGDQILHRDEIWFVEKVKDGSSALYPLTDFKPREGQNIERRYLGGSYGAVPVLDPQDFADAVLSR